MKRVLKGISQRCGKLPKSAGWKKIIWDTIRFFLRREFCARDTALVASLAEALADDEGGTPCVGNPLFVAILLSLFALKEGCFFALDVVKPVVGRSASAVAACCRRT
jgi:hypothetical protein